MKLDLKSFLQVGTPDSMMRLMAWKALQTGTKLSIISVIGCVIGFLLAIFFDRKLDLVGGAIGSILGGVGIITGAMLVPAFGGKAAQSKWEIENAPTVINQEDQK